MARVIKSDDEYREPANVRLFLPDAEAAAEGLTDIGVGKKITLTIEGTVKSYDGQDFMGGGARLSVTPTGVSLSTADGAKISFDDALTAAEKTV